MRPEHRLHYLLLMTVPLVAAFSCVAGIQLGPMRHTGLLWMATMFVGTLLLPLKGNHRITFPWIAWLPFYALLGLSLAWSDLDWRYNIQLYIQMMVFPLLGIIASYTLQDEADLKPFQGLFMVATLLIGLACAYYMLGPGRAIQGQEMGKYNGFAERPAATSLIAIAAWYLAQIRKAPWLSIGMWLMCFGICILSESRMATLVLLMLWIIHPRLASIKLRIALMVLAVLGGLAAFNTPIIQDRFFTKKTGFAGQGDLSDVIAGKFDSAGRFDAWPIIYEKSYDAPWLGHGVGQSSPFVYKVWAPMDKPHNEYLKMFYDNGALGVMVFLFALLGTLANLIYILRQSNDDNWVASAAYMGWIGFILMAVVDNPLVYGNNFLHPLFLMVGAANAIAYQRASMHREIDTQIACPTDQSTQDLRPPKILLR